MQTSRSVAACFQSLLDPLPLSCLPKIDKGEIKEDIQQLVEQIKDIQRPYWPL